MFEKLMKKYEFNEIIKDRVYEKGYDTNKIVEVIKSNDKCTIYIRGLTDCDLVVYDKIIEKFYGIELEQLDEILKRYK